MTAPKTAPIELEVVTRIPHYDEHGHELFPLTDLQLMQLKADLNPDRISSRKQGGSNLSYLEAYDVKAMLTKIFGFGGWSATVVADGTKILKMEERDVPETVWDDSQKKKVPTGKTKLQWRAVAQAIMTLHIHQLGATYSEASISSQDGIDPGEVSDFAIKTAESDALKRCAINLGTTFGLSLYNAGGTRDVVGPVLAPGQRQIEQDLAGLKRRLAQPDMEAAMEEIKVQIAALTSAPQGGRDEASVAEVAGGARAAEEVPSGIDQDAKETAVNQLADGFTRKAVES